ncbi:DUF3850 domain-containing protein [Ensifer sp. SSB1]|uniref:DUF3850 domain-containing protein n=1 Tax=Ensifer sp. SSB1 TaxID=2795385 RepID=UPI001A580A51|nr:DUF3850 domain-containing protein [Ensifer sp. SSB1]MBK5571301.1 DUF3850 domain-containing protein [Ensifer sp. SSB1]
MNSTEREPVMHELKCDRGPFQDILSGHKKAEVRRDDRDFRVGDTLNLLETVNTAEEMRAGALLEFTGGQALKAITHVQRGYGLPDGIVVLSFDEGHFVPASAPISTEPEECWSHDNENFNCNSLCDLLDSYGDQLKPGMTVYVGTANRPTAKSLCRAGDVIDLIGDRAADIGGDYAGDFPDVDKAAVAELGALLEGWIEKHCLPANFYEVSGVRKHVLTADDLAPREQVQG